MSKNSFRIDDILSGKKETIDEPISVKKRAFSLLDSNYIQADTNKQGTRGMIDHMENFNNTDFQKTLLFLLSQHSNSDVNSSANINSDNASMLMSSLKQQLSQSSNIKQNLSTSDHYNNEYFTRILNQNHYNNIIGMASQK